jgi:hypothetical protein
MTLAHPALSTVGRRKGRVKFKSAADAQRARELDRDWAALQAKHGVTQEDKRRSRAMKAETLSYSLGAPAGRETRYIPSRDTGHLGTVSTKQIPRYTGTKILGIGTLHKSNGVPIFSEEEAVDIATMRRG